MGYYTSNLLSTAFFDLSGVMSEWAPNSESELFSFLSKGVDIGSKEGNDTAETRPY